MAIPLSQHLGGLTRHCERPRPWKLGVCGKKNGLNSEIFGGVVSSRFQRFNIVQFVQNGLVVEYRDQEGLAAEDEFQTAYMKC